VAQFVLSAPNLKDRENISEFDWNLDPALAADLGHLTFSNLIKTGSFNTPTISESANTFKADGDGYYDLQLSFTTGENIAKTFANGDTLQYTISGTGISASSFDFESFTNGGDSGPFTAAAQIQNTAGASHGGSGWVADSTGGNIQPTNVPEPSTMVMVGLGAIALASVRLRRRE
jgi:hypothetical protein